jgi:acyl-CoA thioesterase II
MPGAASSDVSLDEDPAAHLSAVLAVEELGPGRFLGRAPLQAFDRIYGGQLAAQSLLAAARSIVDGLSPVSAHINFLRVGVVREPVVYSIEDLADGRSFATRLVRATQHDRLLSVSIISFQNASTEHPTLDYPTVAAEVRAPEELPIRDEAMVEHFGGLVTNNMVMPSWPVEVRYVDHSPWDDEPSEPRNRLWMRSLVTLPDDRMIQSAALLYAGDLQLPEPILQPQELRWVDLVNGRGVFGASLDYTVWFHRPFRFDGWLLQELDSSAIANSRGLTMARWRGPDGQIVASATELVAILAADGR